MRVAVFFISLCVLLLLKGYGYVYTGTHHNYTPTQHIEKTQQVKFIDTKEDDAVIDDDDPDREEEYLISDDIEDDDTDSLFARKYRLLINSCLIHSHPFILRYLYNCPKASLNFSGLLSCKYITQKVLRI
jgi:hypothetical protein